MTDAGLLRDREFVRYLVSRGLSATGSMATYIALPVLVYRTSDDAGLTALVAALEAAPYLLFGLLAGALTDRWDRKRVMVVADLLSAVLLLTIPAAAAAGRADRAARDGGRLPRPDDRGLLRRRGLRGDPDAGRAGAGSPRPTPTCGACRA